MTISKFLDFSLDEREDILRKSDYLHTWEKKYGVFAYPLDDGVVIIGFDDYGHIVAIVNEFDLDDDVTEPTPATTKYRAHWYPRMFELINKN